MYLEEEMIRLHQQIETLLPGQGRRSIQFIASRHGEGTSSVAREFAFTAATRFARRVVLFEFTDESRPHPEDATDSPVRVGDTTLYVAPLPHELIASSNPANRDESQQLWQRLGEEYELIVIDSPPATRSSRGLALTGQVDGVVLVLEAETTRWPVAAHVKESIVRSGGRVLGVVFNKRRHYIPAFIYNWL
jgi:hypothetical protein